MIEIIVIFFGTILLSLSAFGWGMMVRDFYNFLKDKHEKTPT